MTSKDKENASRMKSVQESTEEGRAQLGGEIRPASDANTGDLRSSWFPWRHPALIGMPYGPDPSWPYRSRAVFLRRTSPLRALKVIVDANLLEDRHEDPVEYLLQLITVDPIDGQLCSGDLATESATELTNVGNLLTCFRDWVEVRESSDGTKISVVSCLEDKCVSVISQSDHPAYQSASQEVPVGWKRNEENRWAAELAAKRLLAAKTLNADLFITDRPLVVNLDDRFWSELTIVDPRSAIPIVGLYLRQQGRYVHGCHPHLGERSDTKRIGETNEMSFYWMSATSLLPSAKRWESAVNSHLANSKREELRGFPQALYWRLYQILKVRDRLLTSYSVVPNEHTPVDDVLTDLEQILLWLNACFDILARVAHIALGFNRNKLIGITWRKSEWLDKVRQVSPKLAKLAYENQPGGRILTLISILRNRIHEVAFSSQGTIYVVGNNAMEMLLRLPSTSENKLLKLMDDLGGRDDFGIVQPIPDAELYLHAGVFLERILPLSLRLMDDLARLTPVDSLPGVNPINSTAGRSRSNQETRYLRQLGLPII